MPPRHDGWARTGALLVDRRIEIDPRYKDRMLFSKERGLNWRLLYDIERAKRENFKPESLTAIEVAYELVPGSLARTNAGGPLEPRSGGTRNYAGAGNSRQPERRGGIFSPEPALDRWENDVRADILAAIERYGANPSAEQVFPDNENEQDIWRNENGALDYEGGSTERVRLIARLRWKTAQLLGTDSAEDGEAHPAL